MFKLVPASLSSSDSHKLIQARIHSTAGPYSTGYYRSYFCVFSPNSIALQADYVTVFEDRPIMSEKYRLPVIFGQKWPTQQSHGLFAIAELLVIFFLQCLKMCHVSVLNIFQV